MLMSSGAPRSVDASWVAEPKLDGWRAIVTVDAHLSVRSRTGRFITALVPELQPLADLGVPIVLDGELVALGDHGNIDFYALSQRMIGRRSNRSVIFCAFDVLWLDGNDCTQLPYQQRRRVLDMLELAGPAWCTVPSVPAHSADLLLDACGQLGQEGVVYKRTMSRYVPGVRTADWRKLKTPAWRTNEAPRRLPAEVRALMEAAE
jgi:bifunctional non-homologous end joining protein LigD